MEKIWRIKSNPDGDSTNSLSADDEIGPVIGKLLALRGIHTSEEAHTFFNPAIEDLHDPFLMTDMQKAVERLTDAVRHNERILVYGDYDVDGTTSVALVYSFLNRFYSNIDYYIPHRYDEGYGISFQGVDYAVEQDVSLVIVLDCGIKAADKIEYARSKGVEFIICDHHTPGDVLPHAVACLDPKRPDCNYPDKDLSGCGVGFKFMQAYSQANNIPFEELTPFLDLVAVSIASDIVPVTGENRILADFGLQKLNESPGTGLKSIIEVAGLDKKYLTLSDVVFKIGPRINAAGRVDSGKTAVELLVSNNESMAFGMSRSINACNETRKDIDRNITNEALGLIASDGTQKERSATVIFQPEWHKGVIGIVASRLSEMFHKPAVVLTSSKGMVTGSARSVDGYDLFRAIEACQDLLENFGGHTYAVGFTLRPDNIAAFTDRFEQVVAGSIRPEQMVPQIEVDAELSFGDITFDIFEKLNRFSPFGPGNFKPVFITREVYDFGTSKVVGKDKEHLKLELIESTSPKIIKGIAFGKGHLIDKVKEPHPFDICYTIEKSGYNEPMPLQLVVRDIKFR